MKRLHIAEIGPTSLTIVWIAAASKVLPLKGLLTNELSS